MTDEKVQELVKEMEEMLKENIKLKIENGMLEFNNKAEKDKAKQLLGVLKHQTDVNKKCMKVLHDMYFDGETKEDVDGMYIELLEEVNTVTELMEVFQKCESFEVSKSTTFNEVVEQMKLAKTLKELFEKAGGEEWQ